MQQSPDAVTHRPPVVGLGIRVLQGIGLALGLTLFRVGFGLFSGEPRFLPSAAAAAFWVIALSAGGALGGIVYYGTEGLRARGGWRKSLANVLALLAYALLMFGALLLLLARLS